MAARSQNHRWEVEFSRFFNYPPGSSRSRLVQTNKRAKCSGAWILAKSPVLLQISRSAAASSPPVLTVTLLGLAVEKHFVSNLHFSWPQVSCVPECPVRGSRAVFLSYRATSGQIQKFAVRFPSGAAAGAFMNSVKEQLRDTVVGSASSGCEVVCGNSSVTEITESNGFHYRLDEESSFEQPLATYPPEVPAWTYNDEQSQRSLPPLLANNIDTIFSGFPPSFTELLTNCSSDAEKEKSTAGENANSTSLDEASLNSTCDGAAEPSKTMADEELKSDIVKHMTDASFHDLLFRLEHIIDDLGGDLSL